MDLGASLNNGRYNLVEKLGSGGMSVVFRAEDRVKKVELAVKVLKDEYARDKKVRKRFEDEAVLMQSIQHPNIVRVLDVGKEGESVYLVMELVGFGSLAEFLKLEGPLPPRWASEVMQNVLKGLQVAHDANITHRDIKPQNILLTSDGVPKLADFGIARLADTDATVTGQRLGTPAYMSPEQLRNAKSVDHRSDLYSCAATLYTLVTGREAFDLSSAIRDEVLKELPADLAIIVGKGSSHHPADRYASATEMEKALDLIHDGLADDALKLPERITPRVPGAPMQLTRLDPTTEADPHVVRADVDDTTDLDPEPKSLRYEEDEQHGPPPKRVVEEPPPPPPPPTVLDRLNQLPVPLWFLGFVAVCLVVLGGTVAIYLASSAYSAVTPDEPVAVVMPAQVQAAPVAVAAPVVNETVPMDVLEEEAAKEASTTKKVSSYGTLSVSSRPTSEVAVDGKSKGWNSWTGKVSAGTHTVRFRSGDGQQQSAKVKVKSGKTTHYCWDFKANATCL